MVNLLARDIFMGHLLNQLPFEEFQRNFRRIWRNDMNRNFYKPLLLKEIPYAPFSGEIHQIVTNQLDPFCPILISKFNKNLSYEITARDVILVRLVLPFKARQYVLSVALPRSIAEDMRIQKYLDMIESLADRLNTYDSQEPKSPIEETHDEPKFSESTDLSISELRAQMDAIKK